MTESSRASENGNGFRRGDVTAVAAAHFVHDVYGAFLAPLLPLLMARHGLSLSLGALLDVTRKLPSLLNPLVGLMADRAGVKAMVVGAPALGAVCMSMLGVAPSFPALLALLLLSGLASAVFHVPGPVLIKSLSGRSSGRGMSYYMVGGELARTAGPLLITAAVSWWGLEGSVRVLPLGLLASFLLHLRLRNLKPRARARRDATPSSGLRVLRRHARLWTAIAGFLFFRYGIKLALTLYLPTYLTERGRSLWVAGLALALLQFAGAAGTIGVGPLADRFGHRRTLVVLALLTPVFASGLVFGPDALAAPLLIAAGMVIFATGPVLLAVVQEQAVERPAFVNGVHMTLNFGISALAVMIVGAMGDRVGLDAVVRFCAVASLLAAPFALALPRPPQPDTDS